MTVISPDLSPSRAGSLALIADDLALDFANTESGRGFPSHENHFREARERRRLAQARQGAAGRKTPTGSRREVSKRADLAADLLTQAIALREAIHDIGAALGRRAKPPEAALAEPFGSSRAICRPRRARAGRALLPLAMERARLAGRSGAGPDCARGGQACSRKAIFTASGNAAATPAAGCSMIGARTTAVDGAKWRSAAIAPSSGGSRRGGAGLEPPPGLSPDRSLGRCNARRLLAGAGDRPGEALPHGAAGADAARRRESPFWRKRLTRTGAA